MELSEQNVFEAKERLARKMGAKKTSVLLDRLGKNKQFINAINTPAGQEVISLITKTLEAGVDEILRPGLKKEDWEKLYDKYLILQATLTLHGQVLSIFNTYGKDRETFNKALGD